MCPHCGCAKSKVIETRKSDGGVYRRRKCGRCGAGFIGIERSESYFEMPTDYRKSQLARPEKARAPTRTAASYLGWIPAPKQSQRC